MGVGVDGPVSTVRPSLRLEAVIAVTPKSVRSKSRVTAALLAAGLAAAVLVTGPAASASPSPLPAVTAKVDGVVYAITQVGDRTYIGGDFTSVSGVPRQNVAAIRADGRLDLGWDPSANGVVYALAASSDSDTVFMGGAFTTVDDVDRGRLAAVTPNTGEVIPGWTTSTNNNLVRALVADSGDRLYVGGSFGRIGGRAVPRLAAVDQNNAGAVDTAFAPRPSATVRALTLSEGGGRLYAGGAFTTIAGHARPGVAELDVSTGAATAFAPSDGGVVISMDATPSGRLFFGTTSNRTWAYDPSKGGTPEYRIRTGGDVQAIVATDDEVYIGGHFNTIPELKLSRVALASFLPSTGEVTGWNPGANGAFGVWAMGVTRTALNPDTVHALSIGGDFTRVAGLARRGYTRFDFATPAA